MRYLTSEDSLYNCSDEARRNGAFFIPVGLVSSDSANGNYIHLPFLSLSFFDVNSIVLMDYATKTAVSGQPEIILSKGIFTDNEQDYTYTLALIDIGDIETKCFYFKIQLSTGVFLYTEGYTLIDFSDYKGYLRFESKYPKFDSFMNDLEKESNGVFNNLGGVYWAFPTGEKYRNFLWVQGDLQWQSGKITKTYEGLSNVLTKERQSEEYQIYSPKMPIWYARAFLNVMGGSNLSVFVNQKETLHKKFEVTDFELQAEQKTCLVLPTGKLRSYDKQVFFGCDADTGSINWQLTAECLDYLNIVLAQVEIGYTSGFRELYVDINSAYNSLVAFEIRGYTSYDNFNFLTNTTTASTNVNYTIPIGDYVLPGVPQGLLVITSEQPFENPAEPEEFYCYYDVYITIIRPSSCPESVSLTKTVKFTTKIYKLIDGSIYAPESEYYLNKILTIP